MADNISLKTWAGELNTPLHDAVVRDTLTQMNGIYKGCEVSYVSGNSLHVAAGYGMIKGRLFEIYDTDIAVSMPASGAYIGRLYVHMDLSNTDEPITIMAYTGSTLPDLEEDENVNFDNGRYDLELCTFTATTNAITNLTTTFKSVKGVILKTLFGEYLNAPELRSKTTSFPSDGSIKNTYSDGFYTVTRFPADGTITQTLYDPSDNIIAVKTTSFPANGNIVNSIQEV